MPALLHNMSARPRTQVRWEIDALRRTAGADDDIASATASQSEPSRSLEGTTVGFELPREHKLELSAAELDRAWASYGLRGAALVFPWRGEDSEFDATPAGNLALAVNVLGRARAGVLMAHAELVLDDEYLARSLASDDPRLVRLALGEDPR